MKKYIYLAGLLTIAVSCKNKHSRSLKEATTYPHVIDSLSLQHLYDETKWKLYCIYSDDTLHFHNNLKINDTVTFGTLNLSLDNVQIRHDTTELNFIFLYKDSIPVDSRIVKNFIAWGAVYKNGSDTVISYSSSSTGRYFRHDCSLKNCPDRFVNPVQPEVIKYINENKGKVNPWFLDEAKKRNLVK